MLDLLNAYSYALPTSFLILAFPDGWQLLRNQPARNAVTRISRWIGLHVVGLCMDHQCDSSIAEQRMLVVAKVDAWIIYRRLGRPIQFDGEIVHITSMRSIGILQSVLLVIRIQSPDSVTLSLCTKDKYTILQALQWPHRVTRANPN